MFMNTKRVKLSGCVCDEDMDTLVSAQTPPLNQNTHGIDYETVLETLRVLVSDRGFIKEALEGLSLAGHVESAY